MPRRRSATASSTGTSCSWRPAIWRSVGATRWRVASTTPSTSTASITSTPTSRRMRRASATRSPVSTTSPGRSLKQGVIRVDGDVVIDTSLWNDFQGVEGPVPPIFVNDNLVDVEVTGAAEGEPATVEIVPQTDYFTVESDVETVAEDGADSALGDRVGGRSDHAGRQRHDRRGAHAADDAPRAGRCRLGAGAVHRGTRAGRHRGRRAGSASRTTSRRSPPPTATRRTSGWPSSRRPRSVRWER